MISKVESVVQCGAVCSVTIYSIVTIVQCYAVRCCTESILYLYCTESVFMSSASVTPPLETATKTIEAGDPDCLLELVSQCNTDTV